MGAAAQAAGPSDVSGKPHPILGQWTWKPPGKTCTEMVTYRADGSRSGASGEETTEGQFQITPNPSLLGFYRLTETLTSANGKRDCWGDLRDAGSEYGPLFFQLSPAKDLLIVCKSESLEACYGPLRKTPL